MSDAFFKRLQTVLALHARSSKCVRRGNTLRREKLKCCGTVEIFDCAKREREVHHTKCRTCEYYTIERNTNVPK